MIACLTLLVALTSPASHAPQGEPTVGAHRLVISGQELKGIDAQTAQAASETAHWTRVLAFATVGLAIATFLLGIITVGVTLYDRNARRADRAADALQRVRE